MRTLQYVLLGGILACNGATEPTTQQPTEPKPSIAPIVQEFNADYFPNNLEPSTVELTCRATDEDGGLEKMTFSGDFINREFNATGKEFTVSGVAVGVPIGTHTHNCTATDKDGNSHSKTYDVFVRTNTVPDPAIGNKGPTLNKDNEYVWRVYSDRLTDAEGDTLRTTGKLVWGPGWPDAYVPRDSLIVTGGVAIDTTVSFIEDWVHFWYVTVCDQYDCKSAEDRFVAEFPEPPNFPFRKN